MDGNGNWSWRPESNIGEGTHEYTATATDEAGNESVPSAGITITVDTLARILRLSVPLVACRMASLPTTLRQASAEPAPPARR
ncbi:Ig-like domain-containing protein [Enterobacter hormaechei]